MTTIQDLGNKSLLKKQLHLCTARWPELRASCDFGSGVDLVLIPRAMQAEEDLVRGINYYKSLLVTHARK